MSDKPILKSIHDLRPADFHTYPLWRNVHGEQNQPWYGETDEITYRPWPSPFPYRCDDPTRPDALVIVKFQLADGTKLDGCLTAMNVAGQKPGDLSGIQPLAFGNGGELVGFYCGSSRPKPHLKAADYRRLGRSPDAVFPVQYEVPSGLLDRDVRGTIEGFCWLDTGAIPRVTRWDR